MVSRMEKPRVMITFLPVCVEGSTQAFESIVEHMGPLDVVLDCILESDETPTVVQVIARKIAHSICLYV